MATGREDLIGRVRRGPSPFLRRRLAAAGIDPGRFSLADLARLAPVRPADLDLGALDDPLAAVRLADAPPPVRLGTCRRGDVTVVLTWTARDLARTAAAGARLAALAGLGRGARVANTLDGGFATPGSLIVGDAVEALGALDVPLGPARDASAASAAARLIARVGIEALVVDPSTALPLLAELAAEPPPRLRTLVTLDAHDALPGTQRARRWLSVPEVSVFATGECSAGSLHVDDDVAVEEVGGRLLFSSLAGDAPLFRYDPGVAGEIAVGSCGCGVAGMRIRLAAGS